ncbi:MAG: ATP-dependent DNA helicase, partial [Actinobacteria bacterium]|nr:ATP-dependent DNA helicase [Actinomycetota bacterium]
MTPDEILQSLDEAQRRAAMEFGAPVLIRAGAGSGKTRTVTSRIAYGIATGELDARHCLAVTFTTRAAGELRSRLGAMGVPPVAARTFHSAALRQLRFFWPQV